MQYSIASHRSGLGQFATTAFAPPLPLDPRSVTLRPTVADEFTADPELEMPQVA